MKDVLRISRIALAAALVSGGVGTALAQTPSTAAEPAAASTAPRGDDEIIVTARKRDETLISVPVVVTAVSGAQLTQKGVTNLDGLARLVPQMIIGPQGGAVQGGNVTIRGISGPDQNPFGDQAVSFNIDGVQVAKATVRRLSDFDMAQVEILKGPQALFFGKNSPAGIISIRTADPTNRFEAGAQAGYEFEGHQFRGEGYVSGPVSDTLGVRLAGFVSDMRGYLDDATPADSPYAPRHGHNPKQEEFGLRGTVVWNPTDAFSARLKLNYAHLDQNGPAATTAFTSCPDGVRQSGSGIDQCKAGGRNVNAGYGTVLAGIPGTLNNFRSDGENFLKQKQILAGLELNYHLSDAVTLTSVTGYYDVDLDQCQNYENDTAIVLPSCNVLTNKEFSQELRISTDYDGPINFTGGLYYGSSRSGTGSITYLFGDSPILDGVRGLFGEIGDGLLRLNNPMLLNNYYLTQRGKTYSAYLQLSYKPIDVIEINVGGRYSQERKRLPTVRSSGGLQDGLPFADGILDADTEIPATILPVRKARWNDFSPEATISYRPTGDLTLFTSYKHGFLSGGFNSGSVTFALPNLDLSYNPQTIKGFESGVKAILLDRTLRVNLSAYSYKVADQQVSNVFNSTNTISNAGAVSVKGVEFDFNYRTPLEGLSVNGAAAYNRGRYTAYPNAPCYGGQTLAQGCVGGQQDLGGTELIRAPKWNLSGGFNYEALMGSGLKLGLNGGVTHSTSYLTDASSAPNGRQPKYTLLDAGIRVGEENDTWEVALIGRNLTNKYYYVATSLVPFAASAVGNLSDRFGSVSRGRELLLRLSYKFAR